MQHYFLFYGMLATLGSKTTTLLEILVLSRHYNNDETADDFGSVVLLVGDRRPVSTGDERVASHPHKNLPPTHNGDDGALHSSFLSSSLAAHLIKNNEGLMRMT